MQSTQIRLAARPVGEPDDSDFDTVTAELPDLADGQALIAIHYLSLDPYMRGRMSSAKSYAAPVELGEVMVGGTVGEVLESRSERLSSGDLVLSYSGWQSHDVVDADRVRVLDDRVPVSTALGVLGMPGFTAYAGLTAIGRPSAGETLAVAAATGPVGSAVGQIAKIHGLRTIGIAGGPAKVAALTEEFGFDVGVDHRATDFADRLTEACPDGIDIYFENVGGHVAEQVFGHLNTYARVPVCGLVAGYNATAAPEGPDRLPGFMRQMLTRSLTVRGFIQDEFTASHGRDFVRDMTGWVAEGRVRYREDVVDGLENAPEAFRGLLAGRNFGKLLVRVG